MITRQAFANRMADFNGGSVEVQTRSDVAGRKGLGTWHLFVAGQVPTHSLRGQMLSEIVFDVGDHGDWRLCVIETHALWQALNRLGIPFWGSLSGGKGTHTHIFGPPRKGIYEVTCGDCNHDQDSHSKHGHCKFTFEDFRCTCRAWVAMVTDDDWRKAASAEILEVVNSILGDPLYESCDYRLLAPSRHMQREFGERKEPFSPFVKSWWTTGPGFFLPLPATREAAYKQAQGLYPEGEVPVAGWLDSMDRRRYGVQCPKSPMCIPSHPDSKLEPFGQCASCPMGC